MAPPDMLKKLEEAELYLFEEGLLDSNEGWLTKYIDYHPPLVERAYRQWGDYRISIHRIYPCEPGEALLHPHPWPGAFRVFGGYNLGFGYSETNNMPEITHTMKTSWGFSYEMTHRHAWHYVAPTASPVLTIMINGPTWGRASPQTANAPFRELTSEELVSLRGDINLNLKTLLYRPGKGI